MRSEDALRRALTQAVRAEHQGAQTANTTDRVRAEAFARGARAALQWAVGDTSIDPFGGVGIHEMGDRSFYPPAEKA